MSAWIFLLPRCCGALGDSCLLVLPAASGKVVGEGSIVMSVVLA